MGCDVINLPAQVIEDGHVCIHVVEVVGVGRVLLLRPVAWQWAVQVEDMLLGLGLIVNAVKTHNLQRDGRDEAAVWEPLRYLMLIYEPGRVFSRAAGRGAAPGGCWGPR